jgi:hypothetical protein
VPKAVRAAAETTDLLCSSKSVDGIDLPHQGKMLGNPAPIAPQPRLRTYSNTEDLLRESVITEKKD